MIWILIVWLLIITIIGAIYLLELENEKQRTRDMRQKIFMNRFKADHNKYMIDMLKDEIFKDVDIPAEMQEIVDKMIEENKKYVDGLMEEE